MLAVFFGGILPLQISETFCEKREAYQPELRQPWQYPRRKQPMSKSRPPDTAGAYMVDPLACQVWNIDGPLVQKPCLYF